MTDVMLFGAEYDEMNTIDVPPVDILAELPRDGVLPDVPPVVVEGPPVDIFSKAAVLQLQFRRLGTRRKVNGSAIDIRGEGPGSSTDRDLVHVTKEILDSPELVAIAQHDGATARYIDVRKSGPAFANQGGFHLVSLALKASIDEWLDTRIAQRESLVERFMVTYETRKAETVARLGPLGAGVEYPSAEKVRAAFGVTRRYMQFGYTDPREARAWQNEALNECRAALRVAFADLVSSLAERLTPGADGTKKIFRDSLVVKFDEFVRDFSARNLADDRELARLVEQARGIMAGVDPGTLRKREGLRNAIGSSMEAIKAQLDPLMVESGQRMYSDD
jgi:hypothetical protein